LKGGSIYFQGPCVDLAGASGDVSPEYIEKRKERDGNDHSHITLLHATTIAQLSEASGKSIEEMTQKAFELFCKVIVLHAGFSQARFSNPTSGLVVPRRLARSWTRERSR